MIWLPNSSQVITQINFRQKRIVPSSNTESHLIVYYILANVAMNHSSLSQTKKKLKDEKKKNKKSKQEPQRLDQAIDDLVEIRVDEEVTTWPIRLRLGEFFVLSLPKCRRRRRRRRHRMMIATMREKTMKSVLEARHSGTGKDTERLLKVLSINNVDQDNRYNVTRCSVM